MTAKSFNVTVQNRCSVAVRVLNAWIDTGAGGETGCEDTPVDGVHEPSYFTINRMVSGGMTLVDISEATIAANGSLTVGVVFDDEAPAGHSVAGLYYAWMYVDAVPAATTGVAIDCSKGSFARIPLQVRIRWAT